MPRRQGAILCQDGPMTASIERDEAMEVPVWLKDRYDKLGRSDELSNL